jgi:hypothetical protein
MERRRVANATAAKHRPEVLGAKTPKIQVMKTTVVSKVMLAAALSAFALVPVSALPRQGLAYNVREVVSFPADIKRGDTSATVMRQMGSPHQRIGREVWVYRRFGASRTPQVARDGCDTLIVTLGGGRVKDLKLVNGDALKIYVKAERKGAPVRFTEAPTLAAE